MNQRNQADHATILRRFIENPTPILPPELYLHSQTDIVEEVLRNNKLFAIPGAFVRGAIWVLKPQPLKHKPFSLKPLRLEGSFAKGAQHKRVTTLTGINALNEALAHAERYWGDCLITDTSLSSIVCHLVDANKMVVASAYVSLNQPYQFIDSRYQRRIGDAIEDITTDIVRGLEMVGAEKPIRYCVGCFALLRTVICLFCKGEMNGRRPISMPNSIKDAFIELGFTPQPT